MLKKLEEQCENIEIELQEFYNNETDSEEDRSRRCNLRIDGVTEKKGETRSSVKRKFKIVLRKS